MKNNFITKIIGATLAFAMMIGVGIGINNSKEAKRVFADGTDSITFTSDDFSNLGSNNYSSGAERTGSATSALGGDSYDLGSKYTTINSGWQWKANDGITYNKTALPGRITNISVQQSTTAAFTVRGGTTLCNSKTSGTQIGDSKSTGTMSWDVASGTNYTYFVICRGSSAAKVTSVTVTFETTSGGPTALTNPNPQYNDSNKTVSWTTDAHADKYQVKVDSGEYADINTETYDASDLTAGIQHTVYIKAVSENENYTSTEGSVTFTPTAPFASKDYALCTSVNDLEAGVSYLITSGKNGNVKTMSTTEEANFRHLADATVSESKIASESNFLTLTLGGTSGAWTFHTENYAGTNGYLAPSTGSSNQLKIVNSSSEATISFDNDAAVITFTSRNDRNIIRYNSDDSRFACYSSGQAAIYLWKEFKQLDHLNVEGELVKTSYYDSETFDSTGLTISAVYTNSTSRVLPANAIDWGNSLTAGMTQIRGSYTELGITKYTEYFSITVAADSLSTVALSGSMGTTYFTTDSWNNGTLVVTATYASGRNVVVTDSATIAYFSDSAMQNQVATPGALGPGNNQTIYVKATYQGVSNTAGYSQTVTVTVEHGSVSDDPLTVAEAVELVSEYAHNTQTTKQYYVQGIVSQIVEADNKLGETENYATFYLKNGDVVQGMQVYRITPAAGCTNYNDFRVGAEVLIRCQIKKYSSTTEAGTAKSLISISYTAPTLTGIALDETELFLTAGENEQLTASPTPLGAELGNVTWKSSNVAVATVDQEGNVAAVASGSATITAFIDEDADGDADAEEMKAICSVTVSYKATMKYVSNSTTSMTATGNAALVDLDDELFSVDADKGGSNNLPGLNKDDDIRLYAATNGSNAGTYFVVSMLNKAYTISNVVITYSANGSNARVYVGNTLVNGNNGAYAINNLAFKVQHGGASGSAAIKITSIDIFYRDATATEKVNRLETRNTLSFSDYHAGENGTFTYDNLAIRFGGLINKDLWDALDTNEHLIQGYGVMISYEDLGGETFESYYNQSKAGKTVEETSNFLFDNDGAGEEDDGLIFGKDYYFPLSNEKTHPAEASASQKAGQPEGTYYIWNLYKNVSNANIEKEYTAVAYIRVGNELVFLTQTTASTRSLAYDLIESGAYASDAFGGSLAYLAGL